MIFSPCNMLLYLDSAAHFSLRESSYMPWKLLKQINNKIQILTDFFVPVANLALKKYSQI